MSAEPRPVRISGHKLTVSWSGEYGVESTSTGECICGWSESASSQQVVRHEYSCHLDHVWGKLERLKRSARKEEKPLKADALTKEESAFLLDAIGVAYDTACVYEVHENDHDREVMESAMAKLREAAK